LSEEHGKVLLKGPSGDLIADIVLNDAGQPATRSFHLDEDTTTETFHYEGKRLARVVVADPIVGETTISYAYACKASP
jgi:hypothetical protein